jgi:hypothetical protein
LHSVCAACFVTFIPGNGIPFPIPPPALAKNSDNIFSANADNLSTIDARLISITQNKRKFSMPVQMTREVQAQEFYTNLRNPKI